MHLVVVMSSCQMAGCSMCRQYDHNHADLGSTPVTVQLEAVVPRATTPDDIWYDGYSQPIVQASEEQDDRVYN